MREAWLIAKRELAQYFKTYLGYVVVAYGLLFFGILFNAFAMGAAGNKEKFSNQVLIDFFYFSAGLVMFLAILLCFRLFAEERQSGTIVLLYTAPVKEWQIVLGKFLGAYIIVCIVTGLSIYMPLLVMFKGNVSWGHIAVGYLGLFALAAPVVAMGTFASALAKNQVLAALFGLQLIAIFVLFYFLVGITKPPVSGVFSFLDLYFEHFGPSFSRGILRATDFVYYATLTFVFLLSSSKVLSTRRWVG